MSIEKLVDIFSWVCYICGVIAIISIIVTAGSGSDTAALITIIALIICLFSFLVEMGLILWDMRNL